LNNDNRSAEDHCSDRHLSKDSNYSDNVDFNSNALVEPNRETAANRLIGGSAVKSSTSRPSQTVVTNADSELTSVTHMLDVANAAGFRTLLAPSLTPPKTISSISTICDKPDDLVPVAVTKSASKTTAGDLVQKSEVHTFTVLLLIRLKSITCNFVCMARLWRIKFKLRLFCSVL